MHMNWENYTTIFDKVLDGSFRETPYDKEEFVNYVSLNQSRQNRWLKRGVLNEELVDFLRSLEQKQQWIAITEPWCGDASHTVPFMKMLADVSDKIDFSVNLRDGEDSLIDQYLTNGVSKSIPILVVRDKNGNDIFSWGPRPKECQEIFLTNKADETKTSEQKKIELQAWYNKDKGKAIQEEILQLFKDKGLL